MERQIVDPDPGKNYDAAISAGEPHFEMEKINIHRSCPNRSKSPNCKLDDTVLLRENLARFR